MQITPMGDNLRQFTVLLFALFLLPLIGMSQSTVLERGDVLVVSLSTNLGACGDFSGQDEISFVCMKDISAGTSLDFTDNGWEKSNPNKWGESEGVIRVTRTGASISAGTVITFQSTLNGLFTSITPQDGWSFAKLSGSGEFDLSTNGDQLYIMQGGNWANPSGSDNATYSGEVLFGFSTTGAWIADGSQNQSNLYPYLDCFSVAVPNNVSAQSFAFVGDLSAATKKNWVERVKEESGWLTYTSCLAYLLEFPNPTTVSVLSGSFEKGIWTGNKSTDWFECGNWDNLTRPDETTDVVITNSAINPVEINEASGAKCKDLLIESQTVSLVGSSPSMLIKGNLSVVGQGLLDFEQTIGTSTVKLDGDLTISSGDNLRTGNAVFIFNGANKTISGQGTIELNELQLGTNVSLSLEGVDLEIASTLFLNQNSKLHLQGGDIIINNPEPDAIIRFSNSYIISETNADDYGYVVWNIGNRTGDYAVPFGGVYNGVVKDLTFKYSIHNVGVGAAMGAVKFTTYPTNAQNQPMPTTVTHLTNDFGKDNSHHILDRFWIVENGIANAGFEVYPRIEYQFKYNDEDWNNPINKITEEKLVAQRYNENNNTWQDWLYSSTALTFSNALDITLDDGKDYYDIWTLADDSDPLPIELVSFSGACNNGSVNLKWTTASETNNNQFVIERSLDGDSFEQILEIQGSNNSNYVIDYAATDDAPLDKLAYYRLKQIDYDGDADYSSLIGVQACIEPQEFNFGHVSFDGVYMNGAIYSDIKQDASFKLYNSQGQCIAATQIYLSEGYNQLRLPMTGLSQGIYYIALDGEYKTARQSVFVK